MTTVHDISNSEAPLAAGPGLLDTVTNGEGEGIVRLVSAICGIPDPLVCLVDAKWRIRYASPAMSVTDLPRLLASHARPLVFAQTVIIPDARDDARVRDSELVTSAPFIRFLAGLPMLAPAGERLGTLCVMDSGPRVLTDDQVAALEILVAKLSSDVAMRADVAELQRAQSDSHHTEHALRASQQQLEHVIEGSTDGFWDWNMVTDEIEISRRLAEMLGYELDDVDATASAWRALVHPDDEPARRKLLEAHLNGSVPHYEGEHRKRTKTGAWKWILTRGKITERAADGTPIRMTGTQTDIDERKRAEETLDRFFRLSLDLLCIAGLDGVLKRVNPAFTSIFGYTEEQLLATPFLGFIHPDDRPRAENELAALRSGNPTVRFVVRCVCRDGAIKWVTFTATPHTGEGLIYAVGRDVTEEKLAADSIAESEARYRDLFDNASDMIQSVDANGAFLYVNRAWLDVLGYEAGDVPRLTLRDVIDPDHFEDCRALFAHGMAGESVPKVIVDFRSKDGGRRTVEGTVNCSFEEGLPVSTRGIFRDVTERRKAEEDVRASESAMRSIIRSSLSGIATFDHNRLIESVNPAAERILGYPASELVGRCPSILLADPPADLRVFEQKIIHDSIGRTTEWELIRGDGRHIQVELALFEFQTKRGKQLAANIQDVSQRREVERMKREFVSTVSHELRTPLTSIRGSLDLLQGRIFGELSSGASEVVSIAHRNTTRLIMLTNDILDLDRQDSGRFRLSFEKVSIEAVAGSAIDSIMGFAAQNGVAIAHTVSEAVIEADGRRLIQVLVNLLSNAVKFSGSGTTVRLVAAVEGDELVMQVHDEGRGIPEEYLESIFDRFQQVEASDSRTTSGSGLGLSISRGIVEQHGGTIGVVSNAGAGSTFWVRIPRGQLGADGTETGRGMESAPRETADAIEANASVAGRRGAQAPVASRRKQPSGYAVVAPRAALAILSTLCSVEGGGEAPILAPERTSAPRARGGVS